jgi:hypothetical protein
MQLFKEHKRKLIESERVVREKLEQLAAPDPPTLCPPVKRDPPKQGGTPQRQMVRRA